MSTRFVGGMRNSISEIVFQGQSNRNENILLPENIWKLQVRVSLLVANCHDN